MTMQQYCLRWNNHQPNFISVFSTLLSNESLVDVTLAAEGRHLQAHKVVLSACSSYFQSLFTINPCQHPIVILKDVKFADLKVMIDFMYYGEVNVSQEQLPYILKTAEMLKIKGLAEIPVDQSVSKTQSTSVDKAELLTPGDSTNWSSDGGGGGGAGPARQSLSPSPCPLSPSSKRKRLRKTSTGSGSGSTERTSSLAGNNNNNNNEDHPSSLHSHPHHHQQQQHSGEVTLLSSGGNLQSSIGNTVIKSDPGAGERGYMSSENSNSGGNMSLNQQQQQQQHKITATTSTTSVKLQPGSSTSSDSELQRGSSHESLEGAPGSDLSSAHHHHHHHHQVTLQIPSDVNIQTNLEGTAGSMDVVSASSVAGSQITLSGMQWNMMDQHAAQAAYAQFTQVAAVAAASASFSPGGAASVQNATLTSNLIAAAAAASQCGGNSSGTTSITSQVQTLATAAAGVPTSLQQQHHHQQQHHQQMLNASSPPMSPSCFQQQQQHQQQQTQNHLHNQQQQQQQHQMVNSPPTPPPHHFIQKRKRSINPQGDENFIKDKSQAQSQQQHQQQRPLTSTTQIQIQQQQQQQQQQLVMGTKRGRFLMRQPRIKRESDSTSSGGGTVQLLSSESGEPLSPQLLHHHLTVPPSVKVERQCSEPLPALSPPPGGASGNLLTVPGQYHHHQGTLVKQHSHPLLPSQTQQRLSPPLLHHHHHHQHQMHHVQLIPTTSAATPEETAERIISGGGSPVVMVTDPLALTGTAPDIGPSSSSPSSLLRTSATDPLSTTISGAGATATTSLKVKTEELRRSASTPQPSTAATTGAARSEHCPVIRPGPALGCNYCWNTVDDHGRILRRKTKYHCPECQTNLCIVPCFQAYHLRQDQVSGGGGTGTGQGGGPSDHTQHAVTLTSSVMRIFPKTTSM